MTWIKKKKEKGEFKYEPHTHCVPLFQGKVQEPEELVEILSKALISGV